jgi:hypothetical protein
VNDFHAADPGVTEAVLSRAVSGDRTPYRWLCRAVFAGPKRVVDVACGNGAAARRLAAIPIRRVVAMRAEPALTS